MSDETHVRKIGYTIPISLEMLAQIDPEKARSLGWEAPPPPPWSRRLRWRIGDWWWGHKPRLHFGPCGEADDA